MKEKLEILLQEGKEKILAAKTEAELQEIKASLLGKKGSVTEMMKELPKLAPEDRREFGQAVNKVKTELGELVDAHREALLLPMREVLHQVRSPRSALPHLPSAGRLHSCTDDYS